MPKAALAASVKSSDLDQAVELYLAGKTVEEARGITSPPITTYSFYKALEVRGIQQRGRISRREVVPPNTLLRCGHCGHVKQACEFSEHPDSQNGFDQTRCKVCKRSQRKWENIPIEKRIHQRVKQRAAEKGIPFDLDVTDIALPDKCPVLGRPFIYGDHNWTYSIDRKNPLKGYMKGNIAVISNRANMMKSTATTEEVGLLFEWMKENVE